MTENNTVRQTTERRGMTVEEVAEIMGMPVKDVYHWRLLGLEKEGKGFPPHLSFTIPGGRRVVFKKKEFDEWWDSLTAKSPGEKAKKLADEIYNDQVGSSSNQRPTGGKNV